MLVWVGRGTKNNFSNSTIPTDTAGSTYSMIGTVHDYSPLWPGSGEALYASPFAKGGLNDRVSTQQSTQDEITLAAVEVKNGGSIADAQWNEVLSGSPNTSANVTVNGPATLVAVWAGDGDADPMTAVPNNGFQVIDSQLVNTTCAVQTVIAAKEVSASGTYNVTWTATPTQGAHMWLVAVQSAQPQAPDTTPPSAPSNLAATAASQTQINLTWSAATDNVGVTGYQVFRNGSPTPVTTTTATSFNDSGLVASTTYSYTVKAFDAAGNVSGVSNTAVAVTSSAPDTTPPTVTITAPTGILPAGTATTTLAVTTNENATCAYATTPNTAFGSMALFTGTGGMSHSTTLAGLSNGGAYTYYVKCKDAAGNISNDSSTSFSVALPVSGALSQSNLLTQMIKENKNVTLSATTAQFTPPANSFLVANVVTVDNQSIGTQTLSGGGLTWTRQKTFTSPNKPSGYTFTQEVWTAPVSTSAPMSITVAGTGKSGSDPARVNIQVLAFSNYNTAAPIGATASGSSLGSGAATITLSSAPAASSIVVAARGVVDNNTLDSTATPGAGWTEVFDQATSGGYGDLETMVRTGSTATGVTWNDMADPANASLFESSAFALEIKAATS